MLLAAGLRECFAKEALATSVDQDTKYLWPVTLWSVPFAGPEGLEPAEFNSELATIGQDAFDHFRQTILPKELEANARFREWYENGEASRVNLAFVRWQKQVFAQKFKVPIDELFWNGEDVKKSKKVSYQWDAFYKSPLYVRLRKRIEQVVQGFVTYVDGERPQKMRTFIWAEVYRHREFHRPVVKTGSYCTGMLWVRFKKNQAGSAKLMIEDPRGVNPPYGKTHSILPSEGMLNVWPSWTSHFISPNMVNSTNVVFGFISQPHGGSPEFDWEDDPTGSYIYSKTSKINVKKKGGQGDAGARHDEL